MASQGQAGSISAWLREISSILQMFNSSLSNPNIQTLMRMLSRQPGSVRGAILTAYTYINQARILKELNITITPTRLQQGQFVIELFNKPPGTNYNSSWFEVSINNREYLLVANIYTRPPPRLYLNLDTALITREAWRNRNLIPVKSGVLFFTECKYHEVKPQTYATATGQRYLVKTGTPYRDLPDLLVTAKGASTSVIRTANNNRRLYDPILVTNMRPTITLSLDKMRQILQTIISRI